MADEDSRISECELNIAKALRGSPMVKLLIKAMDNSGCAIIPHRHLVCEMCSPKVEGKLIFGRAYFCEK